MADARVHAARTELLRFDANDHVRAGSGWVPVWSSARLEAAIASLMSPPESSIGDVLGGFWEALAYTRAELTKDMSHFVKDVVVLCFTRYRTSYDATDFSWMVESVSEGCTAAQAYLALHALPESLLARCADAILRPLKDSPWSDEAARMME